MDAHPPLFQFKDAHFCFEAENRVCRESAFHGAWLALLSPCNPLFAPHGSSEER